MHFQCINTFLQVGYARCPLTWIKVIDLELGLLYDVERIRRRWIVRSKILIEQVAFNFDSKLQVIKLVHLTSWCYQLLTTCSFTLHDLILVQVSGSGMQWFFSIVNFAGNDWWFFYLGLGRRLNLVHIVVLILMFWPIIMARRPIIAIAWSSLLDRRLICRSLEHNDLFCRSLNATHWWGDLFNGLRLHLRLKFSNLILTWLKFASPLVAIVVKRLQNLESCWLR